MRACRRPRSFANKCVVRLFLCISPRFQLAWPNSSTGSHKSRAARRSSSWRLSSHRINMRMHCFRDRRQLQPVRGRNRRVRLSRRMLKPVKLKVHMHKIYLLVRRHSRRHLRRHHTRRQLQRPRHNCFRHPPTEDSRFGEFEEGDDVGPDCVDLKKGPGPLPIKQKRFHFKSDSIRLSRLTWHMRISWWLCPAATACSRELCRQ